MQEKMHLNLYRVFFESYSYQEQILMHEGNYQQLYYTFLDVCSSQELFWNSFITHLLVSHISPRTKFANKLIASDLLML